MIKTPIINFGNCFRKVKKGGGRETPLASGESMGSDFHQPIRQGERVADGERPTHQNGFVLVKQGPIERAESGVILLHNKGSQFGAIIETRIVD